MKSALSLETVATCSTTKARVNKLILPHGLVDTPVFMPVGTQGSLKGFTPKAIEDMNCQIMLNNTYHLVKKKNRLVLFHHVSHLQFFLLPRG